MGIKVDIGTLRSFEKPLVGYSAEFIAYLEAIKTCSQSVGEGTGVEETIRNNGVLLEKMYNEDIIPAIKNITATLAASADNAEEIQKVMAGFEPISTSGASEVAVEQTVRPAAFKR